MARCSASVVAAALLLCGGAAPAPLRAQEVIAPYGPPAVPPITISASGRVSLSLPAGNEPSDAEVRVVLFPFRTAGASLVDVTFHSEMGTSDPTRAMVLRRDPLILDASAVPEGGEAWGYLDVGGTPMAIRLERGPPRVLGAAVAADTVRLTPEGRGALRLDVSGHRGYGSTVTFSLANVRSVNGVGSIPVALSVGTDRGCAVGPTPATFSSAVIVPLDADAISLCLRAPDTRPGVDYRGSLVAAIGERRFPVALTLRRAAYDATASIASPPPVVAEVTCFVRLLGCTPEPVTFDLRADARVVGASVRLASAPTAGFRPVRDLRLRLATAADTVEGDLWLLDPGDATQVRSRTIESGSQAQLVVEFVEALPPGDHSATLELHALNGDPESPTELTLTASVRLAPFWPLFVLTVAVLVSYLATKGVILLHARRDLRRRIEAIRTSSGLWVTGWNIPPIVRAEASVSLAEAMLDRERGLVKSVVVPKRQASRIKKVEDALPRLKRLTRLASYWKFIPRHGVVSNDDPMVVRRAQKKLRHIITDFDDDARTAAVEADLAELEAWETASEIRQRYWNDLRPDIERLVSSVRTSPVSSADRQALVDAIRGRSEALKKDGRTAEAEKLETALPLVDEVDEEGIGRIRVIVDDVARQTEGDTAIEAAVEKIESHDGQLLLRYVLQLHPERDPGTIGDAIEQERAYAKLKLLWEQRHNPTLREELYRLASLDADVESFFILADQWTWEHLEAQGGTAGNGDDEPPLAAARIARTSRHGGAKPEAYELVSFEVRPEHPDADNYLFKHGIEYVWSVGGVDRHPLTPTTREPRVTQFVPRAGDARISVEMKWGGRSLAVPPLRFEVEDPSAVTPSSAYPWPELIMTGVALLAAVITGTQTEAFQDALTGSFWDYGKVFAWGVGADQLKNLLAALSQAQEGEG